MTNDTVADHVEIARGFLARSKEYWQQGDLHQASEKGWGAAVHIAKAVALSQGWSYNSHPEFQAVMADASALLQNERVELLAGRAEALHVNYYLHPSLLRSIVIEKDIPRIEELIELLAPLT